MSGQEEPPEMPIFGGTLEEVTEAKREWNERSHQTAPPVKHTAMDAFAKEFLDTLHDTRNNPDKYIKALTTGPGPLTRIALRIKQQKAAEKMALDDVAAVQAQESNKLTLDPGQAVMKPKLLKPKVGKYKVKKSKRLRIIKSRDEVTKMDAIEEVEEEKEPEEEEEDDEQDEANDNEVHEGTLEEEVSDEDDDEVDEASHECIMEVIKRGRRQNKPVFLGPVETRPIVVKTFDEASRMTKGQKRHHPELVDKTSMSLDEIINIKRNSEQDYQRPETVGEYSFRSVLTIPNPKKMRVSSDESANDEVRTTSGIKSRLGFRAPRGNVTGHGSHVGHSAIVTKSRQEFWFPANIEVGNWTNWQEDQDLEIKTREEMLDRDRQYSPEHVLRIMTENGFKVEYEAMEVMENASMSEEDSRAKHWMAFYTVQDLKGVGVAPRKELAKQLAAFDVLRGVKERMPQLKLPFCQIPLADRVNPFLAHLLAKECHYRNISLKYNLITELDNNVFSHSRFTAVYTCGGVEYRGYSLRNADDAKKMAAKAAYEAVTGQGVPFDPLLFGEDCGDPTYYKYVWSEAHHVYDAKDSNDIKHFTKTNLFGNNPSAIEEAARKKEKPVDPVAYDKAMKIYEQEVELMKSIRKLKVQRGINPDKVDESFYMDYPNGVEIHIVDSLETRTRKLGEKIAEVRRATAASTERSFDAHDGDFEEPEDRDADDDDHEPPRRRRDW